MSIFSRIRNIKTCEWVLLSLIFATVIFIFTQSALPPEISTAESDASAEIIAEILPSDTVVGGFVFDNIRKIAHFIEFGILGLELSIFVLLFAENKRKAIPQIFIFAFVVAFLDETIQILSGRVAAVSDVWLDMSGFLTFSLITFLVFLLTSKIATRIKKSREQ